MLLHQFTKVDIGKDIHVVDKKGLTVVKKPGCPFDTAPGTEELFAFVGKLDPDAETIGLREIPELSVRRISASQVVPLFVERL